MRKPNYQQRYLKHQAKKKIELVKLMKQRHSTRIFADMSVEEAKVKEIIKSLELCPSSCDRKAVYTNIVVDRADKALLGGLLVGGVGWVHRAPVIVLLFADSKAYVEDLSYMPYLDAGVALYQIYLMAESLGLKACYVNPNMREKHHSYFEDVYGKGIFCGAIALGYEEK